MIRKTKLYAKLRGTYQQTEPHLRALYVCNLIHMTGGLLYGLYYGVYLYKETFSLSTLALDGLLTGVGVWLGYLIGIFLLQRRGYVASFKTAFGLMAMTAFATAMVAKGIADWFMLLALLKGLPSGIYTSAVDMMMVREFRGRVRSGFLQTRLALEMSISVIMPAAVGLLVSQSGGYRLTFIAAGLLYMAALWLPLRLPKPQVSLVWRDVLKTFKRPLYRRHAANRTAAAGFNQINAFVAMMVPFLMLQNETSVGLLTSGVALVASMVALQVRKIKPANEMKLGYGAYSVRMVMSFAFVALWSAPAMIVWQMINKLITPLHDPLQQGLDIHTDSMIMGRDLRDKALYINLLNNTLLFAGSTAAYGMFFILSQAASAEHSYIFQILIVSFALWRFINLALTVWINQTAREWFGQTAPSYSAA